jgi:hypothetical protein
VIAGSTTQHFIMKDHQLVIGELLDVGLYPTYARPRSSIKGSTGIFRITAAGATVPANPRGVQAAIWLPCLRHLYKPPLSQRCFPPRTGALYDSC